MVRSRTAQQMRSSEAGYFYRWNRDDVVDAFLFRFFYICPYISTGYIKKT